LLRVPGLGTKAVKRILETRRHRSLRYDDLQRLRVPVKKIEPWVVVTDFKPKLLDAVDLRAKLTPPPAQLSLF
jgi:predicted DNA-binding helix-hairpin-helix protein